MEISNLNILTFLLAGANHNLDIILYQFVSKLRVFTKRITAKGTHEERMHMLLLHDGQQILIVHIDANTEHAMLCHLRFIGDNTL